MCRAAAATIETTDARLNNKTRATVPNHITVRARDAFMYALDYARGGDRSRTISTIDIASTRTFGAFGTSMRRRMSEHWPAQNKQEF